ncbi:MAG: type I-E CRISPR-associated protein Cse2/CasB [Christensenellales bacterium]|jgi:CRISPR system Cascade subunit CasB
MEKTRPDNTVRSVTNRIVARLDQTLETPSGRATLANLRNSIGRPLSESVAIWPFMFEFLPEEFLGRSQPLSKKEEAILTSLQLYALYRQGKGAEARGAQGTSPGNIGRALNALRTGENTVSTDRRFNALVTATTYEELKHHLRQMITLLKAKAGGEAIDFGRLAQDLYSFLIGEEEDVRLNWAKAYYRTYYKEGGTENEQ